MSLIIFTVCVIFGSLASGKLLYAAMHTSNHKHIACIENKLTAFIAGQVSTQSWRRYFWALFSMNMMLAFITYIILMVLAGHLMSPITALHTIVSFITNTNLQHYAGESALTMLGQMMVVIVLMFASAATGLSVGFAFIRGLTGQAMGNFYQDFIRVLTRFLIPVSVVITILLVATGVPQNFTASQTVTSITGATQSIPTGPIALMEAIKHLGTNGGGYFAANAAMPFENPSAISNMILMVTMVLSPMGMLIAFAKSYQGKTNQAHRKGQAKPLLLVSGAFFIILLAVIVWAEMKGNPVLSRLGITQLGNLEGKEMRFGIFNSALFTTISSAFTTGSVNSVHNSLTPMGGFVPLVLMMLNVVFGGSGAGFMNLVMYVLLTVFMCGLMIGRTPEYLGKRIDSNIMKRVALVIIIHPLLILGFTALSLTLMHTLMGNNHTLTQVLYEFSSASANNGSAMMTTASQTGYLNITSGLVMLIARYGTLFLQLSIAGMMLKKQSVPHSVASLETNTGIFAITLFIVIILISALTFFPTLILGPIAESLILGI